jgi:hypothetical protein
VPSGQGAACKALTPGSGPLMTGGEAVVSGSWRPGRRGVVKTEFWSYVAVVYTVSWRVRLSGTVT